MYSFHKAKKLLLVIQILLYIQNRGYRRKQVFYMLRHSFINIVVSVHKENLFDSIRTKIGNAHY